MTARPRTLGTPAGAGRTKRGRRARWQALAAGLLLLAALPVGAAGAAQSGDPRSPVGGPPLYVSDYGNNRVVALPSDDGDQTTVPFDGLVRPTGMAWDAAGRLYVSDTGNNRVVVLPPDGGEQSVVPTVGLSRPLGLAVGRTGDLYIADSFNDRVVKVSAAGGGQTTVPTTGLLHPWGLALEPDGDLYVS
ncbi:hypothetical protein ACFXPJ_36115, partial [Streptomyces goshikiensis]